jgi:hypothetical protein
MRFDGYWVISDLTGVPDLFPRLGAALRRVVHPRRRAPGLDDLKPYARRVVVVWAVVTTAALVVQGAWVFVLGPAIVRTIVPTIRADGSAMADAVRQQHWADAGIALVNAALLCVAVLGLAYMAYICLRGVARYLGRKLPSRVVAHAAFVALVALLVAVSIWSSTVFGRHTVGGVSTAATAPHEPAAPRIRDPAPAVAPPAAEPSGGNVAPRSEGLTILESRRNMDGSVTVRGVVSPGSRVTVDGVGAELAPDGTFTITLPPAADSRSVVVEAISADGTMTARSTVSTTGQGQTGSSVQQSSIVVRR